MTSVAGIVLRGAAVGVAAVFTFAPAAAVKLSRPGKAAGTSLCKTGEQPLFQCRAGQRMLALCGGAGESVVQYRYGQPGRVELAYPQNGKAGLKWARIGYSGGGEFQVNFNKEGYRYVLWSRTTAGAWDKKGHRAHDFSSGVSVLQGDRVVSEKLCVGAANPWVGGDKAERLLPEGEPVERWCVNAPGSAGELACIVVNTAPNDAIPVLDARTSALSAPEEAGIAYKFVVALMGEHRQSGLINGAWKSPRI